MNSILKLLERLLGKAIDPALLQQFEELKRQEIAQLQMQQQSIYLVPRQSAKSTALQQMAGCTPPGTVQRMQAQQLPYKHQDIMEEYERYIAQMVGVPKKQEPEEVVMEFSLLEE